METNTPSKNKQIMGVASILILIAVLSGILFIVFSRLTEKEPLSVESIDQAILEAEDYDGSTRINPPGVLESFTLTNQHGDKVSLDDLKGKLSLLTFGYTHCPDVCPLTLNEFKTVEAGLGDDADKVQFVFVSVDGDRDTAEALSKYFEVRDISHYQAWNGTTDKLDHLTTNLGVFYEYVDKEKNPEFYIVNHTAGSFLINQEGQWVMRYAFGTEPEVIIEDLEAMIQ
ncbi:hypothetical protein MASR2M15_21910 [Anaerolineales bacterium]